MPLQMPEAHRKSAVALSSVQVSAENADDWVVVLVSALYSVSAAAYTGKTRFRM